ncbi:Cyclic nucleotide-binding domain [Comamonadaceae bacterium]
MQDWVSANGWVGQTVVSVALVCALLAVLVRFSARLPRRELRSMWFFWVLGAMLWLVANIAAWHGEAPWWTQVLDGAAVLIGLASLQILVVLVFRLLMPAVGLGTPRIAQDLTFLALALGAGFYSLSYWGVDPSRIFTTSAVLTAVLAFAMQDTLGNVLGGVVLQLDNSLRVGDMVRVDDISGTVVDVRWRYTAIETADRETVVVPNSWLMKNRFRVLRPKGQDPLVVRRTVFFHVDVNVPPSTVMAVMNQAVADAGIATVSTHRAANSVLLDVTAGYCRYGLRYWLADPDADTPTDSKVRMHVLAALERNGIRLGAVQEQRTTVNDAQAQEAQARLEHSRRLATVQRTALFQGLTVPEQELLAQHLVHAHFVAGGVLTRQGAAAHWLYLIVQGTVSITTEKAGVATRVSELGDGEFFGEVGMLTGEPRGATVTALTDVACYRLDKQGFAQVLMARPEIAQEIALVIEQRQSGMSAAVDRALMVQTDNRQEALLSRIKHFFGMVG